MPAARFASVSYVDDDPRAAARAATQELRRKLGGQPDWVLAFFSADLDPAAVVDGLSRYLPPEVQLAGCSSSAEIDSSEALTRSLVLLGARTPEISTQSVSLRAPGQTPFALGAELGQRLSAFDPQLVVLLPDVLTVNATQLLRGVQSVLGQKVPVIGGAAADNGAFKQTFLLDNQRRIHTDGVVALALKGPLRVATAARSGYLPVSIARTATRVENGNIVLEIDGRPALDVYREFLGPRANEMPGISIEFPIGCITAQGTESSTLTRAIFAIDENRRSLTLGGDIPQGSQLRILSAARADVLAGAKTATELALAQLPEADLALIFSCISRKIVLGTSYKNEFAQATALLPAALPKIGFYTFGELSPVHGVSEHHESTFTLALVKLDGAAASG